MITNLEKIKNDKKLINVGYGSAWKIKTKLFSNKCIIPYLLYQDDFEVNNALCSKSGVNKTSAFYITFPLLNAEDMPKLNNILMCCLTKTYSLQYGSSYNFGPLCYVLKDLEEYGIEIETGLTKQRIYFILAALTCDNLSLNTVMGYTRSFSSNYFCRICKVQKGITKTQTSENKDLLRNEENYQIDILADNCSKTEIKEACIFKRIPSFQITDNVSVDIMHDISEGICHTELSLILKYFIYQKHFFFFRNIK